MALSDDVDQALADLAIAAVSTLADQMQYARQSKDKIAAANSILDRLGYGRATRAQAELADRDIRNALEAAAASAGKIANRTAELEASENGNKPQEQPPAEPATRIIPTGEEW